MPKLIVAVPCGRLFQFEDKADFHLDKILKHYFYQIFRQILKADFSKR